MFATALFSIERISPDTNEPETIRALTIFRTNQKEFAYLSSMDAARLATADEIAAADAADADADAADADADDADADAAKLTDSVINEPELQPKKVERPTTGVRFVKDLKYSSKNNDDIVG